MATSGLEPASAPEPELRLRLAQRDQEVAELRRANAKLTRALGEALEQQTAAAEVLQVISRSAFELQPVLDTLIDNAVRLSGAATGTIMRLEGDVYRQVAQASNHPPEVTAFFARNPVRPGPGSVAGRVARERRPVHIENIQDDPEYEAPGVVTDVRTILGVPMMRSGVPIGVFILWRPRVEPFTDKQIELVSTFADQAVIAIENVRLFQEVEARDRELAESLEQQTATSEVLQVISRSAFDLQPVLETLLENAVRLCGADEGTIHQLKGDAYPAVAFYGHLSPELRGFLEQNPMRPGRGTIVGRVLLERRVVQISDVLEDRELDHQVTRLAHVQMMRTLLGVPMMRDGVPIGVIIIRSSEVRPFTDRQIELLTTFADQAVIAIENVRLFQEVEDKSRQLEVASQHKSEFLANMSHELRTPLNAILGFSEVLLEKIFGELNAKQAEYLQDILTSGRHLLSLINDILDLSKVEAGRMELEPSRFSLPEALVNGLTMIRERASRHGIQLSLDANPGIGEIQADERKVKQVIFNLLSNAIKFTPDGGHITVTAGIRNDEIQIAVRDTGIGIVPEDQARIFDEFRQVGHGAAKSEGTGLGLALAKKFIELHGGHIWVESQVEAGSVFTFTLPIEQSTAARASRSPGAATPL